MSCFCNSSLPVEACCEPIIAGIEIAESPIQLMRSRYSAYATGNAVYIYQTYAKEHRHLHSVTEIEEWAKQCVWLKLVIHSASDVTLAPFTSADNSRVCFSAFYKQDNRYFLMKEDSRFVVENGRWYYLDGDIIFHNEIVAPKRNDECFCESGKKFKKCCGR